MNKSHFSFRSSIKQGNGLATPVASGTFVNTGCMHKILDKNIKTPSPLTGPPPSRGRSDPTSGGQHHQLQVHSSTECLLASLPESSHARLRKRLSRGVAVEGELVDGAAGQTSDDVLVGSALDVAAQGRGGLLAEEGQEVGAETGDVGGGHRGAGDGILERFVSLPRDTNRYLSWVQLTVAEEEPIQALRMLVPGAWISTMEP